MVEPDRVELTPVFLQHQFQMLFLQDALIQHTELVAKHGRRKALPPDMGVKQSNEIQTETIRLKRAVGLQHLFQGRRAQPFAAHGFEGFGKCRKVHLANP